MPDTPGPDTAAILQRLEESLLDPRTRASKAQLDALLADDFLEIGRSGRRYHKADILQQLPAQAPRPSAISVFELLPLSDQLVLVTYILIEPERRSARSSVWKKQAESWRIVFHQGTPLQF